jgi:hypothetical protein
MRGQVAFDLGLTGNESVDIEWGANVLCIVISKEPRYNMGEIHTSARSFTIDSENFSYGRQDEASRKTVRSA